jgi:hypothetical protein
MTEISDWCQSMGVSSIATSDVLDEVQYLTRNYNPGASTSSSPVQWRENSPFLGILGYYVALCSVCRKVEARARLSLHSGWRALRPLHWQVEKIPT